MITSKINFGTKTGKSIFERRVKPTEIIYGDLPNIEADAELELNELQIAFRKKAKEEKETSEKNTEGDFWSCIVFKDQQQRDKCYELLGIKSDDLQYINGQSFIKALELNIEKMEEKTPGKFRVNRSILELSIKS